MVKKISWAIIVLFALLIGIMPFIILFKGYKFGIEETKDILLYKKLFWKINFYIHVSIGGIPLLIGWAQFSQRLRAKYVKAHRLIGKIYVASFLITSLAGFFIAFYATGGLIPALGFGTVALIAFFTTLKAYWDIRKGDIWGHQKMMYYSYACCLAAVSLRLWQPILIINLGSFDVAYKIVAWLSWLPNLGVAYWIIQKKEKYVMVST